MSNRNAHYSLESGKKHLTVNSSQSIAAIDGVEYRVLGCHFDQDMRNSGLFMEILLESNDKVPSHFYPFGAGFLFNIAVPPVNLKVNQDLIVIEFDDPDKDSCVTVYTGEHDGLINVRASLGKEGGVWKLQMSGEIDLTDERKEFFISCDAKCFHGLPFESLPLW